MVFSYIITHIFFREVEVSGLRNIPKDGPVILVCAPHANQFIDAAVVYVPIKQRLGRNVSGVIAEHSYQRRFIGLLARMLDSIPVPRAQDNLKPVKDGKIYVKKSNVTEDGEAKILNGEGTKFTRFEKSGLIGLPNKLGNYKIKEVTNDEEIVLAKPIASSKAIKLLTTEKAEFKYCNKVDTNKTFQNVFNHLYRKGYICIFPEGGSHDRTELLPLKPGVGIMALGSVAAITQSIDPDAKVYVVPTGLYYFHRNKFRSRAVLEFGEPIVVGKKDGDNYIKDPRKSVDNFLEVIKQALRAVIITAPDRDTLTNIQAIRRLYKTKNSKPMNLATINETNRRLLIGYTHYQENEKIQHLADSVKNYNERIYRMGLKDYQIKHQDINSNRLNALRVLARRLVKLAIFGSLSLPGVVLFAPVFLLVKVYSKKKQAEALLNSTVKIKAEDVVATWKVLVAVIFAPALYVLYSVIGVKIIREHDLLFGITNPLCLFISCYLVLVFTTYSAYRTGEAGMDIIKSLPPLIFQLFSQKSIIKIKQDREALSNEVTDICDELGPELFPDYDKFYEKGKVESESQQDDDYQNQHLTVPARHRAFSLPSLSNVAFFSNDDTGGDTLTTDEEQDELGSSFENIESINIPSGANIHATEAEQRH